MSGNAFFSAARTITGGEIAGLTGARLRNPAQADVLVHGLAAIESSGPGDLVFTDGKRRSGVRDLEAAAILCPSEVADDVPCGIAVLISTAPQRAFAQIGRLLYPDAAVPAAVLGRAGVSAAATVDARAEIEGGVTIEPGAVVAPEAMIGAGTVIAPGAVVGRGCRIGRNCFIGPNAAIQNALIGDRVVIHGGCHVGQDGFGYVPGRAGPEKMPQLGRVVIQDGVEIGAGTAIDRGALGDTVIGENTKIDNLVQIAHNVRIGRNCLIASHTGISGSVTIGDNSMLGGRVGIADHVTIGANVQLAAASGVMHDIPAGAKWGGVPAQPIRDWLRGVSILKRLAGEGVGKRNDV